jgi:hypothetical protein
MDQPVMARHIFLFFITFLTLTAYGQEDLGRYLRTHHYSFSPDSGFDARTQDTLRQRLKGYQLVLQAEGGSHYLTMYTKLPLLWIRFLRAQFGLRHFFREMGYTQGVLMNRFLDTGDTTFLLAKGKSSWTDLYAYNRGLDSSGRVHVFGIDFERPLTYIRGLRLILPDTALFGDGASPKEGGERVRAAIGLIRDANDTLADCDYILDINRRLRKGLLQDSASFRRYLGGAYREFARIVWNGKDCGDTLRNRNDNMAANFLAVAGEYGESMYFGELGEAHTVLNNRDVGSLIDRSPGFYGKVATVNLYCYQCSTPREAISNWPLRGIEKDILADFLPWCTGDFTLFDLNGSSPLIAKYKAYGPFLIIARNQH